MANVDSAMTDLYGTGKSAKDAAVQDRRMTAVSRKWSSSGLGLSKSEKEARRLEKKGTFAATMDEEAGTVTLSKDDFKKVMGKLGGESLSGLQSRRCTARKQYRRGTSEAMPCCAMLCYAVLFMLGHVTLCHGVL